MQKQVRNKSNIGVINYREQSCNNASNMSGTYKRIQEELKKTLQVCRLLPMCCPLVEFSSKVSRLLFSFRR